MSETAPRTFSTLVVAVLIAVGVFAFAAFFVLSAYAPALRDGTADGRAHALSEGAVGYAAFADLVDRSGTEIILSRNEPFSDGPDTLTVLTPSRLGSLSLDVPSWEHRTLIVLPKWDTFPDQNRPGWVVLTRPDGQTGLEFDVAGHLIDLTVRRRGDIPNRPPPPEEPDETEPEEEAPAAEGDIVPDDEEDELEEVLEEAGIFGFGSYVRTRQTEAEDVPINPQAFDFGPQLGGFLAAPSRIEDVMSLQTVAGEHIEPVWSDQYGRIVLGRVTVHPYDHEARDYDYEAYVPSETYVLADPDVMNTMGLASRPNARAAVALVSELSHGRPVRFDLTAFGFARPQNLLTVALEPPFLAASLAGLFTALMLAWHATARFGPPEREVTGYALGKAALADNTAALLSSSGKVGTLGPRYAKLIRGRIAGALGLPRGAEARIDEQSRRTTGTDDLAEATKQANEAEDGAQVLRAARRLHETKEGMNR